MEKDQHRRGGIADWVGTSVSLHEYTYICTREGAQMPNTQGKLQPEGCGDIILSVRRTQTGVCEMKRAFNDLFRL